jgi:hypothetical protein
MKYKVYDQAIILNLKTKRPGKWILIDSETGEIYKGNSNGYWTKMFEKEDLNGLEMPLPRVPEGG